MKTIVSLLLFLSLLSPALAQTEAEKSVNAVLDDFHAAAAAADGPRYFGHFADNAVFLGTDLKERWSVEEFRAYAMPFFSKGKGWTYTPQSRHVYLSPEGDSAWFDEVLKNDKFGLTRGSGVLVKAGANWKVAQYHLTLPVPNELIESVVEMIEKQ